MTDAGLASGPSVVSGLVIVDKPQGITSHAVVSRVRRLAGTRKVGHAGTLDPMATGVLVVGINRATRLMGHLMLTEKAYDATIRLGAATVTDDAEGEVMATCDPATVTDAQITDFLLGLLGEIEQVPTAVSAIKVDGKRAYQRVRDGEDVQLKSRRVTIHDLGIDAIRRTPGAVDVDSRVRCSSGTYIRAIARDLGIATGVGGHLTQLRRTAVGSFGVGQARTLEELDADLGMIPIADAARATFPSVDLDEGHAADVRVGRRLTLVNAPDGEFAVFAPSGEFLALYAAEGESARPVAVFVG